MKKYIVAIISGIVLAALICVAIVIPMEKATAKNQGMIATYEDAIAEFINENQDREVNNVEVVDISYDEIYDEYRVFANVEYAYGKTGAISMSTNLVESYI